MRIPFVATVLALLAGVGCSKDIGDACIVSSDCSPNGDRLCDVASPSGYCTIQGCEFGSCPEDSACIRFFTGGFANRSCDPATEDVAGDGETNACSVDELCSLVGECVPRSSEVRFCMKTCGDNSDCRSGYECRGDDANNDLQREHGGEAAPGYTSEVKFCAAAPAS